MFAGADKSGQTTGCATGTANCDLHSVVDANGFPNTYPLYTPTAAVKDQQLTEATGPDGKCSPTFPGVAAPAGTLCGDYAVNTIQPFTQPYAPGTVVGKRLPLLTSDNIGDHLSAKGVSWAWYSGGWDNAAGNNGRDVKHPLGPGWTNGPTNTATGACVAPTGVNLASGAVFPNCPDALVPVPPSAVQLLRQLRGRDPRPRRPPEGRAAVHARRAERQASGRQLRQARR